MIISAYYLAVGRTRNVNIDRCKNIRLVGIGVWTNDVQYFFTRSFQHCRKWAFVARTTLPCHYCWDAMFASRSAIYIRQRLSLGCSSDRTKLGTLLGQSHPLSPSLPQSRVIKYRCCCCFLTALDSRAAIRALSLAPIHTMENTVVQKYIYIFLSFA